MGETNTTSPELSCVVGIGASAGGLDALSRLLENVDPDLPIAWVVVTHLAPDHDTLLHQILGRRTKVPVELVEHGVGLRPGRGYVIPPGMEMIVSRGRLLLTGRETTGSPNLPIDTFFRSLATECGNRSVAVVLSGTGRDGSRGIHHVQQARGYVVVQDRLEAKFPAMPTCALETGDVDDELEAGHIGDAIASWCRRTGDAGGAVVGRDEALFARIFRALRADLKVDFAQYKRSTVSRRIERRMLDRDCSSLEDYVALLETSPDEVEALYADLLIGVTRFFRDPEAWRVLAEAIQADIAELPPDREYRGWSAGCATGQEAYSLAIIISEAFRALDRRPRFRLFATDIHRGSLEVASQGRYSAQAIGDIPVELRDRYFEEHDGGVAVVRKSLRDRIVFANHDITRDPPFTRLDVVSCRNTLIYLLSQAQQRVITLMHFALRRGGILFLGPSETSSPLADEFAAIDRSRRLYRKRRDVRLHPDLRRQTLVYQEMESSNPARRPNVIDRARNQLVELHAPPTMLVDARGNIVHSFSGMSRYLTVPDGAPTQSALELITGDLRSAVSAAVQSCRRTASPVAYRGVRWGDAEVDVTAQPAGATSASTETAVLVSFVERAQDPHAPLPIDGPADIASMHAQQLEQDLMEARENLQTVLEEMETSNEELQATNEELLASNEELQSTNEELNSVNEELYSVNEEHQAKIVQLQEMSADMEHILQAADINLVFLDAELRIRTFTPGMRTLLGLVEHDQGRSFSLFASHLKGVDWQSRLQVVLDTGQPYSEEVTGPAGIPYQLRLMPYRRQASGALGVVIVLSDLRAVKQSEQERQLLARLVEASADFVCAMDDEGHLVRMNRGASRWLKRLGKTDATQIGDLLSDDDTRRVLLGGIDSLQSDHQWQGQVTFHGDITIPVSLRVERSALVHEGNLFVVIGRDITELQGVQERLREADRNKDRFIATLSHELRNPVAAISHAFDLLTEVDGEEQRDKAAEVGRRQVHVLRRMVDDLLDVARIAAGHIRLRLEVLDLRDVVRHARTVVQHIHPDADVGTTVPDQPVLVLGDETRLQQVLVNLLTNAVRYGRRKPVHVSLSLEDAEAVLCVSDEGIGLSAEDMKRVFDPFFRAESTASTGVGIGLTLSRDLVHMHHGKIDVESDGKDTGCTFRVELPLSDSGIDPVDTVDETGCEVPSGPLRILIVDDNEDSSALLVFILQADGHEAVAAPNLAAARKCLEGERYDVMLLDITLPDGVGHELSAELVDDPRRPGCIIAMSGLGGREDIDASLRAGCDDHLVKPIDLTTLRAALVQTPAD